MTIEYELSIHLARVPIGGGAREPEVNKEGKKLEFTNEGDQGIEEMSVTLQQEYDTVLDMETAVGNMAI